MNTLASDKDITPWYKQGWPWFIISLPASAVVAGIITLIIAINAWDGVVVDDYYKEGKAIVQVIDRTIKAKELGMRALLNITTDSLRVTIQSAEGQIPENIIVSVIHPTRSGHDQKLTLTGNQGVFEGAMTPLSTGQWRFQIEDGERSWRLDAAAYLPNETEITIDPSAS